MIQVHHEANQSRNQSTPNPRSPFLPKLSGVYDAQENDSEIRSTHTVPLKTLGSSNLQNEFGEGLDTNMKDYKGKV